MAKPSGGVSFKSYLRSLPKEVIIGVLRAMGILPMPKPKPPIGYWARDEHGRWELRVPAHRLDEPPPA